MLGDPYALGSGEWLNDEMKWPCLQWPDIHSYLINIPSLYSKENLKSYTTLDAYGYVTDNHVQDILVHDYNTENFVALKTEVLPSQRQGKRTVNSKEMTPEKCLNLERITKNQAQSQAWQTHRIGLITNTTLHRVCTARSETAKINFVNTFVDT